MTDSNIIIAGYDTPAIDNTTVADWRQQFRALDAEARVDSEGGSEWRGMLAYAICDRLSALDPDETSFFWVMDALMYAQTVERMDESVFDVSAEIERSDPPF